MTEFKAKMHQIRFRLRLRPRPRWGSLQRSPRPHSWIWVGGRFAAGEGLGWGRGVKGEGGEVEGRERKLLLNQGPLEPCYATESRPQTVALDADIQAPSQHISTFKKHLKTFLFRAAFNFY